MSPAYSIAIPNDKATTYKVVTLIIAIINALAFGYAYLRSQQGIGIVLMGALIATGSLIIYSIRNNQKNALPFKIEISFGICAIIWFVTGNVWLGLPLLIFALLGMIINKKPIVQVNEAGIFYPSFSGSNWPWDTIEWVILKDGILTIEKKDNHLLQITLDKQVATNINEIDFNSYCAACLQKPIATNNLEVNGENAV
jgi:hypothetical protein